MNRAPTPSRASHPPDRAGDEPRPVVGADALRHAPCREQPGEHGQHVVRGQPPLDPDGQALPAELVDHHQHPERPAVAGAVLDEVVGPDVVRAPRPEPDAGPVVQPRPAPLGLPARHLEPLAAPDPLHPFRVHPPAGRPEQGGDPAVAVPPVQARQPHDRGGQRLLVRPPAGRVALDGPVLAQGPAGPPLGDPERLDGPADRGPAALGAG